MTWSGRSFMACPWGFEEELGGGRSVRGRGFLPLTIASFTCPRRQSVAISCLVGSLGTCGRPRPCREARCGATVISRSHVLAPASPERVRGRLRLPVPGEHTLLVSADAHDPRRRGEVGEVPDLLTDDGIHAV